MSVITSIVPSALEQITAASEGDEIERLRVHYLGKNGTITELLKQIGTLPTDQRRSAGEELNKAKLSIQEALKVRKDALQTERYEARLKEGDLPDITLPGRGEACGAINPITLCRWRIEDFFVQCGFTVVEGNEIENDFYNFSALNIPEDHPARAMHDTFYLRNGSLLRTHTSSVQIHVMQQQEPPLRIIAPGRVYRCDSDMTHSPMFHQVEGLLVEERTSFADLKGMVEAFLDYFFENEQLKIRFRPSYFPFTEPSAEVDILDKNGNWLEVMGCGMVHPNVLKAVAYPENRWRGYAFGVGIERLAMLLYGIDDLRLFFNNDIRFLEQFSHTV
ncbi:MAG: phenylalanine--tRNA ligase subunit alpha [Candidatus Oxydemutatoraceae bacterium WSBS_2016_MAG_OTU14]